MTLISSFVALFLALLFSLLVSGAFCYIICKICFTLQLRRSLYKLLHAENKVYRRAYWFKPKYTAFLRVITDSLVRLSLYFLLILLCVIHVIQL